MIGRLAYTLLMLRALCEFVRYDVATAFFGFQHIYRKVTRRRVASQSLAPEMESMLCEAVTLAACFYIKPVLCLQRSVAATLLLRKYGIDARLVIGYRPAPFFSHSWVEVDGRVVNDSPAYKERLQVLCTA